MTFIYAIGAFSLSLGLLLWVGFRVKLWTFGAFVFLMAVSVTMYAYLGGWRQMRAQDSYDHMMQVLQDLYLEQPLTPEKVEVALSDVSKNLPDDPFVWYRLGEIYEKLSWLTKAKESYEKSLTLAPQVIETQIKFAYASALKAGGVLEDKALLLVKNILSQEPNHLAARNLLAMDAFKKEEFGQAADIWQSMLKDVSLESKDERVAITRALDQALQHLPEDYQMSNNTQIELAIDIALSPQVKDFVQHETPVFVFAKRKEQPGPPLAVARLYLSELPKKVSLSPLNAMQPGVTLESGQDIIVTARVASQFSPLANPGDWQGQSVPVRVTGKHHLNIVIDTQIK